ncbi:DUF3322 domain-containing protein [Sphaerisporangium sp. NPDC051017]|uniref:DUF3322 domain-containing protein n=1 Tax=Sphaerisporangium sp. NPDC051017 TaxID=3154636 RepID=UPI0034137501
MRQPDEIRDYLRDRFERHYPDWARGGGAWPLRIQLHPPTHQKRSTDPIGCHTWAQTWAAYSGPGVVERVSVRFPTGTHEMPKTLVLTRAADVAAVHLSTQRIWTRCGRRLVALQSAFPDARFTGIVRKVTDLAEVDYQRLLQTVTWLRTNPTSGLLVRQLPIEGIDTKWLQRHSSLVLAMLGDAGPEHPAGDDESTEPSSHRRRLHERLGLRLPPELIQVAVLDPDLRAAVGGMRHFAASVEDLNRWARHPHLVLILENKETGYALTEDIPGTVVLHGSGFHVANYARISWVCTASLVFYWGDIDAPGFQFVNDLRDYGIPARTILMDIATLDRFRHLTVNGAGPQRTALPFLTRSELETYRLLTDHVSSEGTGLLLEQERIPWPHAQATLIATLKSDQIDARTEAGPLHRPDRDARTHPQQSGTP